MAPFSGAVTRAYTITAPNFAGTATLRLHFSEEELNGNAVGDLALWRWDGTRWTLQGKSSAGPGYVEQSGITAFSPWALAGRRRDYSCNSCQLHCAADRERYFAPVADGRRPCAARLLIYRGRSLATAPERINADPISAQESGGMTDAAYTFLDSTGHGPAYYWLELIDVDGNRARVGPTMAGSAHWYLPICIDTLAR